MKKHCRIYTKYFGIGEQDLPICEWCERAVAVDINHIIPRGMGGKNPRVDVIENLVGMCREDHAKFEAKRISKEELREKHKQFMKHYGQAI
mgnify:CR=1 FL=1